MSILELAIMERTSNKRQHDCHWLYPLCSGQKTKLYRWLLGGAGFDGKYTEINYFVQYQKKLIDCIVGFIQYHWD
jgi:hypothetical protein